MAGITGSRNLLEKRICIFTLEGLFSFHCSIGVVRKKDKVFQKEHYYQAPTPPSIQFSHSARQASLSITNSQSSPKLMSIESVMTSNHLILCHPLLLLPSIFPSIRVFSNESALRIRWPSIGVSASASVLPMNTQD